MSFPLFRIAGVFLVISVILSCEKEKSYVYQVKDVHVKQPGSEKPNQKSTQEFISIAYSDLFGTTITQTELVKLNTAYSAFGDKKIIEDMIIKNFLNNIVVSIPSKATMQADVNSFVINCYKKFYNRLPNAFEKWYVTNLINSDATITPELVYYSMMTANEYRYY